MAAMAEDKLGVAMIGYAFMGASHSQAWRNVHRFFDVPRAPAMRLLCGRNAQAAQDAARKLGWDETCTDWREALERDDVDLVDVCTPGDTHAEIAVAALAAGKHALCEKPLANTPEEAGAMPEAAVAARERGVRSMVAFNYRRVPAMTLARDWIAEGRLGEIRQVRAAYLQDWIADPEFPLVWRLQKERAGSGALGDIGSHIVDLTQFLLGDELAGVSALTETFVKERPLPDGSGRGPVTVDDCAVFAGRLRGGAVATYEATRFATGRKNALRIEIHGAGGALAFDLERLDELQLYDASEPAAAAGFRRVLVTEPEHPYMSAWWPPGHIIGWEHTFIHQAKDFVEAIAADEDPRPSFADGLQVQRVLAAVETSARDDSRWTPSRRRADAATDHAVHRPVGGPAVRGALRAGLGLGLRRPRDRLVGRPLRRPPGGRGPGLRRGAARHPRAPRPAGPRHLQPPRRPGRVRRPDRRAPPGHRPAPRVGRRRSGGCARARRRGDEGHRARRRRARRGRRDRLQRLGRLAPARHVPAGGRGADRARLHRLRRPLGPHPRRLRGRRRALRPGG